MSLITNYEITLDTAKTNYVVIKAKQYDKNSRIVIVHCTANGQEFVLNEYMRAFVQMKKPDGTFWNTDCYIDTRSNVLNFGLTQQATSVTGTCEAELVLVDSADDSILSTMTFHFIIIGATLTQDDIISQTEFGTLANLIIGYEENEAVLTTLYEQTNIILGEETQRQENEQSRQMNEDSRIQNESVRIASEQERIDAENVREDKEQERQAAEIIRINNENARKSAEQGRANFEKSRATAESIRVENEEKRTTLYNEVQSKLDNGEFDGRTVLFGEGIPAQSLGNVGDIYINTLTEGIYPNYLFTKDSDDWTPRWSMRGIDGSDTLPLLSTVFYPSDLPAPSGYEVISDSGITADMIEYGESTIDVAFASVHDRLDALEIALTDEEIDAIVV